MMHHIPQTIKKYLDPTYSVVRVNYAVRVLGKLAPFKNQVLDSRARGYTYQKIHDIIGNDGYNGSVVSFRMFMQKERAHSKSQCKNTENQKEYM